MVEWTRVGLTIVLLVVGLASLGLAGFVFAANSDVSKWGQASQAMVISEDSPVESVPENTSVIAYDDLSPEGQRAFDAALQGDWYDIYEQDDAKLLRNLKEYDYVRYKGEYYEYRFVIGEPGNPGGIILLTSILGTIFTVGGAARVRRHLRGESD